MIWVKQNWKIYKSQPFTIIDYPTLMSYLLYKDGEQTGPFSIIEVQTKISNHEVFPDDLVWQEGMGEWQPVSNVIPPPVPKSIHVPGMPPLPPQAQSLPQQSVDPLAGSIFLLASVDGATSKNHWDVINAETGKVIICIREGDLGLGGKVARSGLLDGWGGGQGLSKFNVSLLDPSGSVYIVMRGGGMGGHSEVYSPAGGKIGDIKRTSLFNLHFEAFAEEGVLFKLISKGIGKLTSEQKITCKDEKQFGTITDSGWGDAKKTLGEKIRLVDSDRMLSSKYTYKHKIELKQSISIKEKIFLFGATYQLAHVAG
jgi:hypothetical protein